MDKEMQKALEELRRLRDWHAVHGNHADALILNDRIMDIKDGRTSLMVERVMKAFESGLARKAACRLPEKH